MFHQRLIVVLINYQIQIEEKCSHDEDEKFQIFENGLQIEELFRDGSFKSLSVGRREITHQRVAAF